MKINSNKLSKHNVLTKVLPSLHINYSAIPEQYTGSHRMEKRASLNLTSTIVSFEVNFGRLRSCQNFQSHH